ncbi:MAG: non-heme iron oxygenase ferredoxin subunit [Chloroflexi bacterium]|nr:non-heme iron oxygenase ferredoxin subunit [Chloroflexota bacterium]
MSWVKVAPAADVAEGHAAAYEVAGRPLAICHSADGYYAIDDICTHDGGPLDQGRLDGNRIECPRHGAKFDIVSGKALTLPAVRPVRAYPTRVENGAIEVEIS